MNSLSTFAVVALTIWGEARGEPMEGKTAVASVIWNRARGDEDLLKAVCLAPKQFSCWNGRAGKALAGSMPMGPEWEDCKRLAVLMMNGIFRPATTATHFHTVDAHPAWAAAMTHRGRVGRHNFYEEG